MNKTIYHVAKNGCDLNSGTEAAPFRTISKAAELADEYDTIIVHEGEYREWVKPQNGAITANARITYKAADGEKVVIKGSERITGWKKLDNGMWLAIVDNSIFGSFNPYKETIDGDWLMEPVDKFLHLGQVYINGKALSEDTSHENKAMHWYAELTQDNTKIYAGFGDIDPNENTAEINVRRSCFYPDKTGLNYITVSGFEFAHAACPWAPPTADQPGMIGPNWAKGWIIENNLLHDARCSAISIGKEISTGHNLYTRYHRKSGYRHQLETVFMALNSGWDKETIGSHIVRNNVIYNCGQNGIVGHMGCAFSEIYNNHIYNIGNLHEFFGYEIAGIKLHAAIDTYIHNNYIHDCRLGMWLDWQAQGTRVSCNIFNENERDIFIEVTHGPHMVDNNIFASEHCFCNAAQGGAYIHNLFGGSIKQYPTLERSTPYHLNHSVKVAGTAAVYSYDDRIYNNIFCMTSESEDGRITCGTHAYNGCTISMEEYSARATETGRGDIEKFLPVKQPAYIDNNVYLGGAESFECEEHYVQSNEASNLNITEENGDVFLEITLPKEFCELETQIIGTDNLEIPRITELPYENADGTLLYINKDINGTERSYVPLPGPSEQLKPGYNKIKLNWKI